jgi:hypothetical protein
MVRAAILTAILASGIVPAAAGPVPGSGGIIIKPLIVQRPPEAGTAPSPYPMTYTEQVAKRLGLGAGGVALTPQDQANPYAPSVSFNGSMLRLKWRP